MPTPGIDELPTVPSEYTVRERWEIDRARLEALKKENWYINQEVEPNAWNGKSIFLQWLDKFELDGRKYWKCCVPLDQPEIWCDHKPFLRVDRAITHIRAHLAHKPYPCGGRPNCKQEGWYVKSS